MMKRQNEIESSDRNTAPLVWQLTTARLTCPDQNTKSKIRTESGEKNRKKIPNMLSHTVSVISLPVSLYGCSVRPDSNLYSRWAVPYYYQSLGQVFVPKTCTFYVGGVYWALKGLKKIQINIISMLRY